MATKEAVTDNSTFWSLFLCGLTAATLLCVWLWQAPQLWGEPAWFLLDGGQLRHGFSFTFAPPGLPFGLAAAPYWLGALALLPLAFAGSWWFVGRPSAVLRRLGWLRRKNAQLEAMNEQAESHWLRFQEAERAGQRVAQDEALADYRAELVSIRAATPAQVPATVPGAFLSRAPGLLSFVRRDLVGFLWGAALVGFGLPLLLGFTLGSIGFVFFVLKTMFITAILIGIAVALFGR